MCVYNIGFFDGQKNYLFCVSLKKKSKIVFVGWVGGFFERGLINLFFIAIVPSSLKNNKGEKNLPVLIPSIFTQFNYIII